MSEYGSAAVLRTIQCPIPEAESGQILLKLEAAGVNYSDLLRRRNEYFMPTPLPFVLGTEAVGEIVALGAGLAASPLQIGDRVLAILPQGGGYAEYLLADPQYCVPLPPQIDSKVATAIFVQGSTAHLMLHQLAPKLEGQTVLIHAAAGGVGSLLVQLAHRAGAKVIATASTEAKLALARRLGADFTINYSNPDWPKQLIAQNDGKKVDLILEMVGGEIYQQSFDCIKPGGTFIVYGAASGTEGLIPSEHFVNEGLRLLGFNLAHFIQNQPEQWQASLGAMVELLARGEIQVQTLHSFPLAQAEQAHQAIEDRVTMGKVVLIPA